jgi:hypothetical protein
MDRLERLEVGGSGGLPSAALPNVLKPVGTVQTATQPAPLSTGAVSSPSL